MTTGTTASGTYYFFNKIEQSIPLVFIHGVGLTHEIWQPQLDFFKDCSTLSYDILGHGKSSLNKQVINFDDFSDQLINLIDELKIKCNEVFIILVNGDDGVACFNYETLKVLLDDFHEDQEWISVKRGLREQYAIAGKDGQLPFKVASSSFPSVITDFIQTSGFGESKSHDRNKAWYKVW